MSTDLNNEGDTSEQFQRSESVCEKADDDTEKDKGTEKSKNSKKEYKEDATEEFDQASGEVDPMLLQKERDSESKKEAVANRISEKDEDVLEAKKEADDEWETESEDGSDDSEPDLMKMLSTMMRLKNKNQQQSSSSEAAACGPEDDDDFVDPKEGKGKMEVSEAEKVIRNFAENLTRQSNLNGELLVKLSTIIDVFIKQEEDQESLSRSMLDSDFPTLLSKVVREKLGTYPDSGELPMEIHLWKVLNPVLQLFVKATDNSAEFCVALQEEKIPELAVNFLKHQDTLAKCTSLQPLAEATSWLIELAGNCYGNLPQEQREPCKEAIKKYLDVQNRDIELKAGSTMFVIMLKEKSLTSDGARSSQSASGAQSGGTDAVRSQLLGLQQDLLSALSDGLTNLLGGLLGSLAPEKLAEKEGQHLQDIGMSKVLTENVKSWIKDKNRWAAFNQDGKMWDAVKEWFSKIGAISKCSEPFCIGICEAGIVSALEDLLRNSQIQEAYMRNDKTKEITTLSISTLHSISNLSCWAKWIQNSTLEETIAVYMTSLDQNIRGLSILIMANIKAECETVDTKFQLEDCDLLLATYLAYKSEGKSLAAFVAKTGLPEKLAANMKSKLEGGVESYEGDEWEKLHRILAVLHLFTNKSTLFSEELCKAGVINTVQFVLANETYKQKRDEEHIGRLLQVSLNILHHCCRIKDKTPVLLQGLYEHVLFYANLDSKDSPLRFAAFLTFAHLHGYKPTLATVDMTTIITEEPSIRDNYEDIEFVTNMWHTTSEDEESVLGNYLAAKGGALVHARWLQDLADSVSRITEDVNAKNFKHVIANLNNLSLDSKSFANVVCEAGALQSLRKIISCESFNPSSLKPQEETMIEHCFSVFHGCAMYKCNMPYFTQANIVHNIMRYIKCPETDGEIKRRGWSALAYIYEHDPEQLREEIHTLKIHTTISKKDLDFYYKLYHTSKPEDMQEVIGKLLTEIEVPKAVAEAYKSVIDKLTTTTISDYDWDMLKVMGHVMWNYTNVSEGFSNALRDHGVFDTLQNAVCQSKFREQVSKDERYTGLVTSTVSTIFNCAQYESNHHALTQLRMVNQLLQYCKADIGNQLIQTTATLATAFLIEEENSHLVRADSKTGVIRHILGHLEDCLYDKHHRSGGFTAIELLHSLCRVAMNDANKVILLYDGILPLLVQLLHHGNDDEQETAGQLAWMLASQKDNKQAMRDDDNLIGVLEKMQHSPKTDVKFKAQGTLFELHKTQEKINRVLEEQARMRGNSQDIPSRIDVMLSYQEDSQNRFRQLADKLKQNGLHVWLALDNMEGEPFTARTSAIETASVVVIGMSLKYQTNSACRSEAEYAHSLQKPIIPLRMVKPFKPSGWLASIVAGKMFIDFAKGRTEQAFLELADDMIGEIHSVLRSVHEKSAYLRNN